MKKTCTLAMLMLLIAGCASNAVAPASAIDVPQEFILSKSVTTSTDAAIVTFTRDSGGPPGSRWNIYIDGQPVVKLGKNERFETSVGPGEHIFGIEPDAKIKVPPIVNVAHVAIADGRYFYRAMYTGSGYQLQPIMQAGDVR